MPRLSGRYAKLPPYMLASVPQKKRELISRGLDVIDLGAGDADLPALVRWARLQSVGETERQITYEDTGA